MKEIFGNLFAYHGRKGFVICITTNGYLKKDGTGVMGRGCAREAVEIDPSLPAILGSSLKRRGNNVSRLTPEIIAFPTKHSWEQDSDPALILQSATQLKAMAEVTPNITYILPRPGCANGRLEWKDVKPILESVGFPDNVWLIEKWERKDK